MRRDALKHAICASLARSTIAGALLLAPFVGGVPRASQARSAAKDDSSARFLAEYRERAARLQEATASIRCEFRCSKTGEDGEVEEIIGTMFAKDESRQLIQDNASSSHDSAERSLVLNSAPAVRFHLRRLEPNGPYQVNSLDRSGDAVRSAQIQAGISANVEPFINAAFQIFDLSIPKSLDDPNTRFAIKHVSREGRDYVDLALTFPNSNNNRSAHALLDPSLDYAIHECEIAFNLRRGKGARIVRKGQVECERLSDGSVVPKRIRTEVTLPASDKPATRLTTVEFVKVTRGDVPDSQFTLQAFGIPDVPKAQRRRLYPLDRWYFWALLGAAVLGWLCLRNSRRRRKLDEAGT